MFGDRTAPCAKCPFRRDVPGYLRHERAGEIADAITEGDAAFWCHQTVDHDDENDGDGNPEYTPTGKEEHCIGAAIMLDKMGMANQAMRIGERMGWLKYDELRGHEKVFDNDDEFIAHHDY